MAPNIVVAPNMTQNAVRFSQNTEHSNTADIRLQLPISFSDNPGADRECAKFQARTR